MTRGNQRESDRLKAQKAEAGKGKKLAGNPQQRREADAKAVAEKQALKAKARAEAEAKGTLSVFDAKQEKRKQNAAENKK
ncbi:hypothetical protein IAT38_000760 [Cryptococcus sp. DSM 104549]